MDSLRIKLQFDVGLIKDEFDKAWFVVPKSTRIISDLSYSIIEQFDLRRSCTNGVLLKLDGFCLLPNQTIGLVREGDLLTVHRREGYDESSESAADSKRDTKKRKRESEDEPNNQPRLKKRKSIKTKNEKKSLLHSNSEKKLIEKDIKKGKKSKMEKILPQISEKLEKKKEKNKKGEKKPKHKSEKKSKEEGVIKRKKQQLSRSPSSELSSDQNSKCFEIIQQKTENVRYYFSPGNKSPIF